MQKPLLVLACVTLAVSACTDSSMAPTQPLTGAQSSIVGPHKIMRLRGSVPVGGVGGQATGILYHGGPIIPQTKVAVIYWANSTIYAGGPAAGTVGTGAQDGSLVGHFLRNFAPSPYFNINSTYTDLVGGGHTVQNSVTYTQYWADNTGVPPANGSTVTNATIQAEINKGFTNGSLTYDPQTIYAVFTLGNTNLGGGFGSQYCAYHGKYTFNGNVVIFAAQPYVGQFLAGCSNSTASPNNDAAADAVINVLAHEVEEAATDPQLNAWFDAQGAENADKCAWTFGATYNNGTGLANMNLGGKDFLIQQNWVNSGNGGCLLAFGTVNQSPVADFTYSCTGLTCNFNGTASHDPDGTIAAYLWTKPNGTTAATVPAWSRTFPAAQTFNLTLKVTDNLGATNTITKPVVVTGGGGNVPPVASFTSSCNASHTCTFTSTSSDSDGSIASQNWTISSGASVSTAASFVKTFPSARTFALTLKVTDNGGATGTITKSIVVP
ncbi:MAG: PKD domain-containing protein [Gemmatimonadales bacterium]